MHNGAIVGIVMRARERVRAISQYGVGLLSGRVDSVFRVCVCVSWLIAGAYADFVSETNSRSRTCLFM